MPPYTLDAETLRPAIIAMSLYLSTVVLAHKFAPRTPSASSRTSRRNAIPP